MFNLMFVVVVVGVVVGAVVKMVNSDVTVNYKPHFIVFYSCHVNT